MINNTLTTTQTCVTQPCKTQCCVKNLTQTCVFNEYRMVFHNTTQGTTLMAGCPLWYD